MQKNISYYNGIEPGQKLRPRFFPDKFSFTEATVPRYTLKVQAVAASVCNNSKKYLLASIRFKSTGSAKMAIEYELSIFEY